MMPISDLLSDLQSWNESTDATYGYKATGVYATQASFDDFVSLVLDNSAPLKTVNYNGTPYWTGYYMSRPAMKILHYDAVRWLLAAEVFGLLASPGNSANSTYWQTLNQAWNDFMPSTHHDYVCGTANDIVYQSEQLPVLQNAHKEACSVAQTGLQALGASINASYADNPVVISNPAGAYYSVVELPAPVPSAIQGIQFNDGQTNNLAQPTYEGGLVFIASVESFGYTTGYLTETEGTMPWANAGISPQQSGQDSYTLSNEYLTVVISADSDWGIQSITDSEGNSLLASGAIGNELVFYKDSGDIYEFGNEYGLPNYYAGTFASQKVTFRTDGTGLGATVLEQGPVRVRLQTVVSVSGVSGAGNYTREYILVAGEPFLRMKTTGSAPSSYSVTTGFQLSQPIDTMVHGTACHWTSVQPLDQYPPPIFRATHRFLLPQAGSQVLGAIYHQDVPAWAFTGDNDAVLGQGALIGCLLRNTPGGPHGAKGTDDAVHTLNYAFRTFASLGAPTTGQPLQEALNYAMPPIAALISNPGTQTLPESGFLASIAAPGVILAAKPGDVSPGTMVLRLYQPTNSAQTLAVTLGTEPSKVTSVTALEDPISENAPNISIKGSEFTIAAKTALNTVEISFP
jgi:alpha-mannosidase